MMSAAPTESLNGLVVSNGRLDVEAMLDLCAAQCTADSDCNDNCFEGTCNQDTGFCEDINPRAECCGDHVCTESEATSGSCPSDCE